MQTKPCSSSAHFGSEKLHLSPEAKTNPSSASSSKEQVSLGGEWPYRPVVAKYDRGRCSRLVLEEEFSNVQGMFL